MVFFVDLDEDAGLETLKEFSASGRMRFAAADVSNEEHVRSAVAKAVGEFGRPRRPGQQRRHRCAHVPPTDLTLNNWNRVLAVN